MTKHTQSDMGRVTTSNDNRYPYLLGGRPLALLTDADTASASEIFTGAIHDTGHDTVFGTTTFGKGIAQDLFTNVPDGGAVKVTTERYFVPSGRWPGDAAPHRYGLIPDVAIENPPNTIFGSANDAQIKGAVAYLKTKLPGP